MLTHPAAALFNVSAPAIVSTGPVPVVSSISASLMNDQVAGVAEMLRVCVWVINVNGNTKDSHQVFTLADFVRIAFTHTLHRLSRTVLCSISIILFILKLLKCIFTAITSNYVCTKSMFVATGKKDNIPLFWL